MGISLTKGANLSLTKAAADAGTPLDKVTIGLGWNARTTDGKPFDLDAQAILSSKDNKAIGGTSALIFFNNKKSTDGSVEHMGDNLTGEGDGDDEQIKVSLSQVPAEVEKIVFPVCIYEATERAQSFGQVADAYVRVVNDADGSEMARYDLSEDAATEGAMIFGELYRNGGDWKFRAVGAGYAAGLAGLVADYGIA